MSGSEQFLGQQLSKQAQQLGLLVDKMGQMVIAQSESIPKYTIVSDNLIKDIEFYEGNTNTNSSIPEILMLMSGTVRLKIISVKDQEVIKDITYYENDKIKIGGNTVSDSSRTYQIIVNGVNTSSFTMSGTRAETLFKSVKMYYDLIPKPEFI